MKNIILVLVIVFLSGCETFSTSITEEQLTNIDEVALVSVVGDQIAYNYVGATVFNNKNTLYPFPNMKVDDYILENMPTVINHVNPKLNVTALHTDISDLVDAYEFTDDMAELSVEKFSALIKGMPKFEKYTYVIVASRDDIQFDEAPVSVNGIGLRKRLGRDEIGSFVLIKFQLINVDEKKELAKSRVFERNKESDFLWLEPFDDNSEQFKEEFKLYVQNSIDKWIEGVAVSLVRSPADFKICADKVYSKGVNINGNMYYDIEDASEAAFRDYKPGQPEPDYGSTLKAYKKEIYDCISEIQ